MKINLRRLLAIALALSAVEGLAVAQLGRKARTVDLNQAESILEDARVQAAYDQFLAGWAPMDPEGASALGLHDFDQLLTSRDETTARNTRGVIEKSLAKLKNETNVDRLDRLGELRFRAMVADLESRAYLAARRDERRSNPLLYIRVRSILDLPGATYGAQLDRVRCTLGRLEMLPAILNQARLHLSHPPRLWTEAAIRESSAAIKALDLLPPLVEPTYELQPDNEYKLKTATAEAKKALAAYQVYLTTAVLPVADGKTALGEEAYDWLLENRHMLKYSNYKLLRLGEKGMKAANKELKRAAKDIDRKKTWQEVLTISVSTAVVPVETLRAVYKRELEDARQHVERQGFLTMPVETLRLEDTPADLRGALPLTGYRAPAPLDASTEGVFYLTPIDPKLPEDVRKRLSVWGHNAYAIKAAAARNAWPGLHVLTSRVRHNPTAFQRTADSSLLTQGWAQYADQLALESGYYASGGARMFALRNKLVAAAMVVVDVRIHCGDWKPEQASQFLQKETLMTPEEADARVLAVTLRPTEAMSGFVGAAELSRIRERLESRLGDQFTLREFHDRLFSYGRVPIALIERHLMKDWARR